VPLGCLDWSLPSYAGIYNEFYQWNGPHFEAMMCSASNQTSRSIFLCGPVIKQCGKNKERERRKEEGETETKQTIKERDKESRKQE
jgi:hypothetical protein